jgi:hypothetical protein
MTNQTITLEVPDQVYQRARRAAEALQRPTEEMIVDALSASLPLLDEVPVEMTRELAAMALLSDETLVSIAGSRISNEREKKLHDSLDRQGRGELDEQGQQELAALMAEYGRTMLRRAHAVTLMTRRGHPVPPLGNMSPQP